MNTDTPLGRKICLSQWVLVLLMGLLGAVIGGMVVVNEAAPFLERLPGIAIGLMLGLTVSGVGVSLYLRWKNSRRQA